MKILGIETATHSGGAALLEESGLCGSVCFRTRKLYSQRLLPSLEWLLDKAETTVEDITTVGVSIGPGSFTGLRIGLSVAKALAYAGQAQVVGVGTLEALAVRASAGRDGALVCPVLDARQGQVYAALYRVHWNDGWPTLTTVRDDWAGPVDELREWIEHADGPVTIAGDATDLVQEHLSDGAHAGIALAPLHLRLPHPEEVALLAASRARAGQHDNLMLLEPRYVRQSYTQR